MYRASGNRRALISLAFMCAAVSLVSGCVAVKFSPASPPPMQKSAFLRVPFSITKVEAFPEGQFPEIKDRFYAAADLARGKPMSLRLVVTRESQGERSGIGVAVTLLT